MGGARHHRGRRNMRRAGLGVGLVAPARSRAAEREPLRLRECDDRMHGRGCGYNPDAMTAPETTTSKTAFRGGLVIVSSRRESFSLRIGMCAAKAGTALAPAAQRSLQLRN